MKFLKTDPWIIGLLLAGPLLLLPGLDNGRLWQDEAETALLGRNLLTYGYPRAFDGTNWINPSLTFREGYAWTYHTWLPMYLAAGSFKLLGVNTVAARLPFALLGVLALWLAGRTVRRLTGDRWLARLTVLLLVTSVPFLLHMRQCRYYAPAVFFTLWSIWAYWRFLNHKRWGGPELTAGLTLLFHAEHGAFLPVAAGLGLHFASLRPKTQEWRRAGIVAAALLILNLPWAIYLKGWQHHKIFSFKEISHHLQFYFRQVNRFFLPVVFWGILVLLRRRSFRGLFERPEWKLVFCLLATGFLFLILIPEQRHFRYLIFLVPWLMMIQAALLVRLFRCGRLVVAAGLAALLIGTDLLHYSAPKPASCRSLLLEYFGELTHPYRGPVDGIVEVLREKARAGQTAKTPYEEMPLIFYLPGLKFEPIPRMEDFGRETFPDWIILRRDWLPGGFLESPYYSKISRSYDAIPVDAPDIPWQNRPDPGYHRFRTDGTAPPVILFRKK